MHFGRSHARSKSRSPAPGSVGSFSPALTSRPPAFLPPSHYAAAAGIPYPGDIQGNLNQDYTTPVYYHSTNSPVSYSTRPERDVSYSQTGETSTHLGGSANQTSKLTNKRKSQLGDIPLLETQLLPSLRDTVDRMTQLPKPPMDSGASSEMKTGQSQQSLSSRMPRSTPDPTIPRMRSQPSPVPKSSLKSPGRRAANSSPSQAALRSPYPMGKSLRTPRSYDISTPIVQNHEPDHETSGWDRAEPARAPFVMPRSTPQSVSGLPKLRSDVKSKSNPGTPQTTHRFPAYATPQPGRPSALPSSSLPRPTFAKRDHTLDDSGSELERQVGRAFSPGRLVITNAVIVPSSSESDHGAKLRNRRSQWIKEAPSTRPPSAPPRPHSRQASRTHPHRDACVVPVDPPKANRRSMGVGLGLNVGGGFGGARERFAIDRDDSDEASIYEDEFDSCSPILQEPIPAAVSGDDEDSVYGQEVRRENAFGKRSPLPQIRRNSPEDRRRQEALLGIVDGLHRDYGNNSSGEHDGAIVQSDSEGNVGTYGLAMGGSADLKNGSTRSEPVHLSRTSSKNHPPHPSWPVQSGTTDDESAYSEHDDGHGAHTLHPSHHQHCQSVAAGPNETGSRIPRVGQSPVSLRQNRSSWKRPPSSLDVQDDAPTGRSSPSAPSSRTHSDRHRSTSPLPKPSSLRSRIQESGTSPGAAHQRSKSRHQPASSGPDASSKRKSMSRVPSGESGSRSSRLLSASPRASGGYSPRTQDDASCRERLGFGIPESLSYCGNVTPDEPKQGARPPLSRIGSASSTAPGLLSRADSDLSVADAGWQDHARISKELSKGAAALFDALASNTSRKSPRMQQHALDGGDYRQDATPKH
ncbi:hypothetical protein C8Q79DRAFT_168414 [Trametes meyenii]|nr:hypothetical protein C8Q79DRAFT_168414 [Trametes meyenii]